MREGREGATNKCGCCFLESVGRRPNLPDAAQSVPQGSPERPLI